MLCTGIVLNAVSHGSVFIVSLSEKFHELTYICSVIPEPMSDDDDDGDDDDDDK